MTTSTFQEVSLDLIKASATNPRKQFNEAALAELAESIKKTGVAQAILLRAPKDGETTFEIVAGERRYRASKLAGKATIPAVIRTLTDAEALEIQVIENLQRADLHPLEEAEGYEQLMKLHNYTAEQLADKVGKSVAFVYTRLKLLALVPEARKAFYAGKLTPSTAILVARIPVKSLQAKAVGEIVKPYGNDEPMSTKEAQRHVQRVYMLQLKSAPFKTSDATLCPAAGACSECPKRTGNQPTLFADVDSVDVCTDPECFGKKRDAHKERMVAAAAEKGQKVIAGAEAKKIRPHQYGDLNGGYISLDATCYQDSKHRTYRKILGKAAADTVLLEDPHSDNLMEIVRAADVKEVLKEKGIAPRVTSSATEEDKKREAKVKIEREYRRRLFSRVREKSPGNIDTPALRNIAYLLLRQVGQSERPFILGLYGWDKSIMEYPNHEQKTRAAIDALDDKGVRQLILDMTLVGDLAVNTYQPEKGKPEQLLATATALAVDPDAIKAEVKAEAKAKLDAKKKPAKKSEKTPVKPASTKKDKPPVKAAKVAAELPQRAPAKKRSPKPAAEGERPPVKFVPVEAWPFPTGARP